MKFKLKNITRTYTREHILDILYLGKLRFILYTLDKNTGLIEFYQVYLRYENKIDCYLSGFDNEGLVKGLRTKNGLNHKRYLTLSDLEQGIEKELLINNQEIIKSYIEDNSGNKQYSYDTGVCF